MKSMVPLRILGPGGSRTPLEFTAARSTASHGVTLPTTTPPAPASRAMLGAHPSFGSRPWHAPPFAFARPHPSLRGRAPLRRLSRFLLALAVLQVADLLSTLWILAAGGVEANPMSAWLLSYGQGAFVAAKCTLALVLVACVLGLERGRRITAPPPAVAWTALGVDLVYGLAVVSNVAQVILFA
jgi:hypothetical protein